MRRIPSRCCARAASGPAATAPPSRVMNSRRLSRDIELARISQRVSERLYNLLAVGEGGLCPFRPPINNTADGLIGSSRRSRLHANEESE
jgi:hypothetical protein